MAFNALYFSRTYDETLSMIVEARNYMAGIETFGRRQRSSDLRMSCEAMRITSRLTQAMAWLMMQRAVQLGEVTMEEALDEGNRLSGQDVCLDVSHADDASLPQGLKSLLDRSHRLYERVSRLESMALRRVFN